MKKTTVDTPRKNSWCTQVNQPGFVGQPLSNQSVRLKTVMAEPGQAKAMLNHLRYGTPL